MRKKRLCAGVWVSSQKRIVIAGAGAIGCYVGGRLAALGWETHFLARDRIAKDLSEVGLTVTDYNDQLDRLETPNVFTDPARMSGADVVLVSVKSAATQEIAQLIKGNKYDVIHYCVPNIASRVARTASIAISNIMR